ncbi:MAG TPA: carbon-nitrogen hydrolase family protein [Planctomicrobium sp.]|nr:carbon-nitrogen hydrolase family protein [Planctomicrobium sp.]
MRIAVVQMDVALGEIEANLTRMLERVEESRRHGADLTIFPECALTGYCFDGLAETRPFAQSIPGPATERFRERLKQLGGAVVFGMIEKHGEGIFNAAVLVTGEGVQASYRKIHLPYLGIDQFATYGDRPFSVAEYEGVRLGLCICYDSAFPESMRSLMLQEADVFVLPTNFPSGADVMTDFVLRTRALENKVYFACSNRIGDERGWRFIGQSQIIDPSGQWIAKAAGEEETILYADIDVELARNKRVGRSSIVQALDRVADRRPEFYDLLTVPHNHPRPGRD